MVIIVVYRKCVAAGISVVEITLVVLPLLAVRSLPAMP
jgi:hypothetical protein